MGKAFGGCCPHIGCGGGLPPLEIFLYGLSFPFWCLWLAGRAGKLAWVEVKAPAQRISKSMKGGCSILHVTWPKLPHPYPQTPPGWIKYLPSGCFEGNLHLVKPEIVTMQENWDSFGKFGVLNMDCREWGTGWWQSLSLGDHLHLPTTWCPIINQHLREALDKLGCHSLLERE